MISWRYHLVSVIAVFLALGLGLLAGTAVLNDNLVNSLKAQTEALQRDLNDLRDQVTSQSERIGALNDFGEQALPFLVTDRLSGRVVVMITHEGVDEEVVSEARRTLELSGAFVETTLWVEPRMVSTTPDDQQALASLLGLAQDTPIEEVRQAAVTGLADRLAITPSPLDDPSDDLLAKLLTDGFLIARDPDIEATVGIGGPDQLFVVVGGSSSASVVPPGALAPIVVRLAGDHLTTAAGEGAGSQSRFVSDLRDGGSVDGGILVTVDDLDLPAGAAALVLGLERAIERGEGGDYGTGAGARLLPSAA